MGRHYQQRFDPAYARKRHPQVSDSDNWRGTEPSETPAFSPNAVVKLQRTIGNQAMQRLIGEKRHGESNTIIQRDSMDQTKDKENTLPAYVAKIVLGNAGELKGKSRIAGHEGKIEVLSLSLDASRSNNRRKEDREAPSPSVFRITITRYVDDLSPRFQLATAKGEQVKTAQFELIRKGDDGTIATLHTLEFGDGFITSYQVSGDPPIEVIQMEFQKGPS